MFLFIDTLSSPGYLCLFDDQRNIVASVSIDVRHQEFEQLPEALEFFLSQNQLSYGDVQGIVVVHGPGSFTGTRVTCLIVNTLALSFGMDLFSIDYFALLECEGADFPYLLQANKREVRIKSKPDAASYLAPITSEISGSYRGYGEWEILEQQGISLYTERDYVSIIRHLSLQVKTSEIHPVYIKDPNISLRTPHAINIR